MGIIRRYQSVIYGNYRKAGLLYGLAAGALISGIVLFCLIIYYPINTPENYITDITLFVATLFFTYRYRNTLPEKKVYFKELMLFGLWVGVVAAIVYGIFLLFYGGVVDTEFANRCLDHFVHGEMNGSASDEEKQATIAVMKTYKLHTWAFIGAFRTAVMSIITAFTSALIFRTEQNKIKNKEIQ